MDLVDRTESSVVATEGNLVVAIHDRQVRPLGMQRVGSVLDEVLGQHPEGICILWVSMTPRPSPDHDAQRERLALIRRPGEGLLRLAFVTESGSMGGALKRSAAYDVRGRLDESIAARMGIFDSLREGVTFVAGHVRPVTTSDALVPRVQRLWRSAHPAGSKLPG